MKHITTHWTSTEIQTLKTEYTKHTKTRILQALPNRTWSAIRNKAGRLRITRSTKHDSAAIWKNVDLGSDSHCAYDGYDNVLFKLESER